MIFQQFGTPFCFVDISGKVDQGNSEYSESQLSAGMEWKWNVCFVEKKINSIVTLSPLQEEDLSAVPTHISYHSFHTCTKQDFGHK